MAGSKPGERRGGRQKGTKNKLSRTIKQVFESAFEELQKHKAASLPAWAKSNPSEFYKLAARLIPHKVESDVTFRNVDVSNFTEDELAIIAAGQATDELITRISATARSTSSSGA